MKPPLFSGAVILAAGLAAAPAMATECASLADLVLYNVEVSTAKAQDAQILPPDPMSAMTGSSPRPVEVGPHCLVEGKIEDRDGVNGRYGIRFQMRLPDDWNGRFLFQGGGGTDGFIAPAIGTIPSTGSTAPPALERGYAVVSMDGGHAEMGLGFGADQQARLDLGYASIGKVTQTAKTLIHSYYNRAPDQSYFMGCSNGGREAMMAAQRYPLEFDGVVVGNPGFRLTRAAIGAIYDVGQFSAIAPEGKLAEALTQSDLDTVSGAILARCDDLDGLRDGIVAAYGQCDFDPESLRGTLPDAKLDAMIAVMAGARDDEGNAVYTGWPWDPGVSAPGWRLWKLGFDGQPALRQSLSVPSTGALFMSPPQKIPANPDYAELSRGVAQVGGYFDADDTFMTTYAARGGKMVIFQGTADPIFSAVDIARWYDQTTRDTGSDMARLFMVPGMTHCGGGTAFEDFDPLTLLEDWADSGEAPEAMTARAPSMPGREMPLCAYPAYARYRGGDEASADSYACVRP